MRPRCCDREPICPRRALTFRLLRISRLGLGILATTFGEEVWDRSGEAIRGHVQGRHSVRLTMVGEIRGIFVLTDRAVAAGYGHGPGRHGVLTAHREGSWCCFVGMAAQGAVCWVER